MAVKQAKRNTFSAEPIMRQNSKNFARTRPSRALSSRLSSQGES